MAKAPKKAWMTKQSRDNSGSTPLRDLPPATCMYCEKTKSLSHTRALFAVIEEQMILCHHCEDTLLEAYG